MHIVLCMHLIHIMIISDNFYYMAGFWWWSWNINCSILSSAYVLFFSCQICHNKGGDTGSSFLAVHHSFSPPTLYIYLSINFHFSQNATLIMIKPGLNSHLTWRKVSSLYGLLGWCNICFYLWPTYSSCSVDFVIFCVNPVVDTGVLFIIILSQSTCWPQFPSFMQTFD